MPATHFTFGPVNSRRLGRSLGVDVLGTDKHCTFNCSYCEIGRTAGKGFVGPDFVVDITPEGFREEMEPLIEKIWQKIDYITFGYNGEPTLNPHLGEFLAITREIQAGIMANEEGTFPTITVFTNSTTLSNPEVRSTLAQFDLILAKLDVGTQDDLERVNRPHPGVPRIEEIVEGLISLKNELPPGHKLAIQSLFFRLMNMGEGDPVDIAAWCEQILAIQPDIVQIYSVARSPAEPDVIPVSQEMLASIEARLRERAGNNSPIEIRTY
ncbi:MAG TPA: radical SAM protein [Candidatus Lokiarchaeia archaeon]|nr:radical SAM protein [Candidatus Lokiarchaeia archaeon]